MRPQELWRAWRAFAVFAWLRDDPVFSRFARLLKKPSPHRAARFAEALYQTGTDDWAAYLEHAVMNDDNCLVQAVVRGGGVAGAPVAMVRAAVRELEGLSAMAAVSAESLGLDVPVSWQARPLGDLADRYLERLGRIETTGFGPFALHHVFRPVERGDGVELLPVAHPDTVTFDDLFGYEAQHAQVLENAEFLLRGLPAANVLLYGDAGTGKSATVKAAANLLAPRGLRLVQITKEQLHLLPWLLEKLGRNPLKFVVFIDDLSFSDSDDDFAALKAVLEGGVSSRTPNTAIFATSNRRHIVRETFSARAGDEVHRSDAMQETVSLSERFGLRVSFDKPGKADYLAIVRGLARSLGLSMDDAALAAEAERFALRKAGRSARAARQVVERLLSQTLKEGDEPC